MITEFGPYTKGGGVPGYWQSGIAPGISGFGWGIPSWASDPLKKLGSETIGKVGGAVVGAIAGKITGGGKKKTPAEIAAAAAPVEPTGVSAVFQTAKRANLPVILGVAGGALLLVMLLRRKK